MRFRIIGRVTGIETIAAGSSVRASRGLRRRYGPGRWRKLKGFALVEVASGEIFVAELHWFEAHGIGCFGWKIKREMN